MMRLNDYTPGVRVMLGRFSFRKTISGRWRVENGEPGPGVDLESVDLEEIERDFGVLHVQSMITAAQIDRAIDCLLRVRG